MIIPQEIKSILEKLQSAGFEAYAVGGCVRDLLLALPSFAKQNLGGLSKKPKDWDVATNALPEQIQEIFSDSFYENKFGTVTVKQDSQDETLREIEVTTYRVDAKYSDKRHPDSVRFTRNLQEDLARRDFTVNAMALEVRSKKYEVGGKKNETKDEETSDFRLQTSDFVIIDPFGSQKDLKDCLIRAVGNPEERFNEDALRMLRAVRFAVELSFTIEQETKKAIQKNAGWLQAIAKERVRDELEKIIMSERPDEGILMLHELGLLEFIIPELEKGIGVSQNRHHIYTIFEHGIFSLKFAAPSTCPNSLNNIFFKSGPSTYSQKYSPAAPST